MSGERTEQPTERKRERAREQGQGLGRSHELVQIATLATGLLALNALMPGIAGALADSMRTHVEMLGAGATMPPAAIMSDLGDAIGQVVALVLPLGLAVAIAGTAANLASGGWIITTGSMKPKLSKLNPISGMKRLLDKSMFQRLGMSLAKLVILLAVSWQVISSRIPDLLALDGQSGSEIAMRTFSGIFELGISITLLLAVVGLADWIIQRRNASNQLKMTKDEVKREGKEQEGDPHVKGQRKQRARQLAFARMMDDVAHADVVVVNPTHLAVALRYEPGSMRAPMIVGKGQRLMAARIREVARRHRIPIIEDVPLARALYPRPVGAEVPADLYRAVARILVLVARLRAGTARPATRRRPAPVPSGTLPSWFGGGAR
jgi:flagellar biosynthetic protein FlhB